MTLAPPLIHVPRGDLPVILSVPHSGRDYPDWLVALSSGGRRALTSLEDPFVDRLAWRALNRGIGAVIARTPRAAVDCNRAEDEIDPSVVEGGRRERLTARARGGLGIIPARTPQFGYLWRSAVPRDQLPRRPHFSSLLQQHQGVAAREPVPTCRGLRCAHDIPRS